jgi:alkylation response protein AidB-like acyl-CoA dehydrogenase
VDFGDTDEEAAFRREARAWLERNAPERGTADDFTTGRRPEAEYVAASRQWQRRIFDAGWAGLAWPAAFGGQGRSLAFDVVFQEEQARFGVSSALFDVAIGMAGPTIIVHGDDRQRSRHLPAILGGEEVWCQLFSEPGAGSDLASLTTRAARVPGGWRIDGQKVWTSFARAADFGILLARSDDEAERHAGITFFLLDMRAQGIDIRPIRQMNGAAEFNEVFLSDVFVPDDAVLGDVNGGWLVAMTTLANERNLVGADWPGFEQLVAAARERDLAADPVVRQGIADAWAGSQLLRLFGFRVRTALARGEPLGALPSVINLFFARHLRRTGDLGLRLLGPAGQLLDGRGVGGAGEWQHHVLTAPCVRIASGTDEIQRTIIGQRILKLPSEPRAAPTGAGP